MKQSVRVEGEKHGCVCSILVAIFVPVFIPLMAFGATIYADSTLKTDCIGRYEPASRTCEGGNSVGYSLLMGAVAAAQPGDVVLLREGTYREQLSPPRSGAPGKPITIKGYPGEAAMLTDVNAPAILISNRSFLVVEEVVVANVLGWGRVESSDHIVFRGIHFSKATAHGTTGGLKFVKSRLNEVRKNRFDDGNDSVVLQESDRNLLDGNTFSGARHSLLSIRCSNFNVIRGNRFRNPDQKAVEIYDCEGTSDAPVRLDATKHNLFDRNVFSQTRGSSREYRYNGIQYGGQDGIVRRNVFYGNEGGGLNFQVYPREALFIYGNRVYNNTFYDNRCYGVSASSASNRSRYFGNIVKNNIFYKNTDCNERARQIFIGNKTAVKLERNAILDSPPGFVAESKQDFRLATASPMVDGAAFATRTVASGNGVEIPVEDVGYFYDGFGIPGEIGDTLRLEGDSSTVRIVRIDYPKRTLVVDKPIKWNHGQGVHIVYFGAAPDMGALESR